MFIVNDIDFLFFLLDFGEVAINVELESFMDSSFFRVSSSCETVILVGMEVGTVYGVVWVYMNIILVVFVFVVSFFFVQVVEFLHDLRVDVWLWEIFLFFEYF